MASGSTARPRVFNGNAQNVRVLGGVGGVHRRGDAGTTRPTCAPSGDAGATLSGSANLDVLAPDSTLREEFEHWRLQEDHFGGGYVSGHAAIDLPTRWSDAESSPSRGASAK